MSDHPYKFERRVSRWARPFGVRPENSTVTVADGQLTATFGPWIVTTGVANVISASTTGPYRPWRVVGPARLSLADRGITFATNAEEGLCLAFERPVTGIDPFGLIKHPTLTVTVDQPRELARALGFHDVVPHIDLARGSFAGVARALRRSLGGSRSVNVAPPTVDIDPPEAEPVTDEQTIESGVGPWFHRRYSIEIVDATLSATELIGAIQADPNVISDTTLAPFVKDEGADGEMQVGDRYTVRTAGPWEGPVEVVDVGQDHIRFTTLDGHMEAGVIDIHATADGDLIRFEIASWARSGDRALHLLYDLVGVAKAVQTEMWVSACERAVECAGGAAGGPVASGCAIGDLEPNDRPRSPAVLVPASPAFVAPPRRLRSSCPESRSGRTRRCV